MYILTLKAWESKMRLITVISSFYKHRCYLHVRREFPQPNLLKRYAPITYEKIFLLVKWPLEWKKDR